jgi:hypothetical protein
MVSVYASPITLRDEEGKKDDSFFLSFISVSSPYVSRALTVPPLDYLNYNSCGGTLTSVDLSDP